MQLIRRAGVALASMQGTELDEDGRVKVQMQIQTDVPGGSWMKVFLQRKKSLEGEGEGEELSLYDARSRLTSDDDDGNEGSWGVSGRGQETWRAIQ